MARLTPSAFISYSWDDDDHKTWVRELSERLVINGVQVFLDQWHVKLGDSLTEFMERKLSECDFALVICTPNYRSRSQARRGGVGYEQ
ncbi:toll/interleukin-1 receptor domain-containing protein [Methylobacterium sp. CM6247]